MYSDKFIAANHIRGLLGVRAIVYFGGRFYSPVYGHCEWTPGWQTASCAIGCENVPSDRHQGCGFHAHLRVSESKKFVEQIRGTADCLVLAESDGRVAVHKQGFRAEQARIVAIVDWDPRLAFFHYPLASKFIEQPVSATASSYFSVPLIDEALAQQLLDTQMAAHHVIYDSPEESK